MAKLQTNKYHYCNYCVPGRKMCALQISYKEWREYVKQGFQPSAKDVKAEIIATLGRNHYNKRHCIGARALKRIIAEEYSQAEFKVIDNQLRSYM